MPLLSLEELLLVLKLVRLEAAVLSPLERSILKGAISTLRQQVTAAKLAATGPVPDRLSISSSGPLRSFALIKPEPAPPPAPESAAHAAMGAAMKGR